MSGRVSNTVMPVHLFFSKHGLENCLLKWAGILCCFTSLLLLFSSVWGGCWRFYTKFSDYVQYQYLLWSFVIPGMRQTFLWRSQLNITLRAEAVNNRKCQNKILLKRKFFCHLVTGFLWSLDSRLILLLLFCCCSCSNLERSLRSFEPSIQGCGPKVEHFCYRPLGF